MQLGTTAVEAEARKIDTYCELINNRYFFQPGVMAVQGSLGESSEIFIKCLCKMLCLSHDDQGADSFFNHRISRALQIGNAACVLETVGDNDALSEL